MTLKNNGWIFLTITILILISFFVFPASSAGTETRITSNTSADQAKPSTYGNYIAWVDSRYGISRDIYLYNTVTLQEYRVTDGLEAVDSPCLDGNRLVWSQGGRDIYWFDISTRQKHKVPAHDSGKFTPKISADRIVWTEQQTFASGPHNDILMYDIGTNLTLNITAGEPDTDQEKPAISGTIIVWEDHRRLAGNYDIYGIDTSGPDPAAWSEKAICTENGDKNVPAVSGDIVTWQDTRISNNYPHIYSAYFSTATEIWNSIRDDSDFTDQQFSPAIFGNTVVWLDTYNDGSIHIGMYNRTSGHTTEPLTSPSTSIASTDISPRTYQNRVVWEDVRSGPSQVYMYTDGDSITCPVADLTEDYSTVSTGYMVNFSDRSSPTPDHWFWEFGDGTHSSVQNPGHQYANPGTYTVMLSVGNSTCRSTTPFGSYQISVEAIPVVEVDATPRTGMAPLTVTFNGSATGDPTTWHWDFGDGITGTGQNITHTYTVGGTYNVRLDATNAVGTGSKSKPGYIHVLSGAHEVASTTINGIIIDNRFGGDFLTCDSTVLPDFLTPAPQVLVVHPPPASGWQEITFTTSDSVGFQTHGTSITGNLTGVTFRTRDISPTGFSSSLGHPLSLSSGTSLPSYPLPASLTTDIWESATEADNLTYQNIIHQNGFSSIHTIAYTMAVSRSNFGEPGDCGVNMSVSAGWVAGAEGIGYGRDHTYIIATGHDAAGNYYGIVLNATYRFHDPATDLDYFTSDIPARYSFLSKFSLARLSGSGNVFQLITLTLTNIVSTHQNSGSGSLASGSGGSGASALQNRQVPPEKPAAPIDPGKTTNLYLNANGVVTQGATLVSTDTFATISIPEGVVAKDNAGTPLASITIKAVPAERLPTVPSGNMVAFAGMAYEFNPDGATFSPPISLRFTVQQAQFGYDYSIKSFDPQSNTWQDLVANYNPQTGIVTAQVSHFCCFALFATSIPSASSTSPVTPAPTLPVSSTPVPVAPTAISVFIGMILWLSDLISKNILIMAGIVAIVCILFIWRRKKRQDRFRYLL